MSSTEPGDPVRHPRRAYSAAEQELARLLFTEHYDALIRVARSKRRRHQDPISLLTADIVHESFLKLQRGNGWQSDAHFLNAAVLAIRQVIADYARARLTEKRNRQIEVQWEDAGTLLPEFLETPQEVVAIDALMESMAECNERWPRIIDARYFAGLTEAETAELMGLSTRTVRREWKAIRAWLAEQLRQ